MKSKRSKNLKITRPRSQGIKKADKGSTAVIMNKQDKIAEGQIESDPTKRCRKLRTLRNTYGWANLY